MKMRRPASTRCGAGEAEAGEEEDYPHSANQADQCDFNSKFPSVLHSTWNEPSFKKGVRVKKMDYRTYAAVPDQLHGEAWNKDTTT